MALDSWRVVIVTGGRDYGDGAVVRAALDGLEPTVVIEGGASGADILARRWAEMAGVPHLTDWALWGAQRKAAGPIRNRHMLRVALRLAGAGGSVIVAAFPGGTGTADMVKAATEAGVPVHRFGVEAGVSPDLVP